MTPLRSHPRRRAILALLLALATGPLAAQELAWSGFGTLGYAQSNRDFHVQRFIERQGSFGRDSLLGVQADLRLGPRWSATVQLKAAPSIKRESGWDVTPTWAFVAWRPTDDWLLRVGRLRVPLYLASESMDVGQTHDLVRLPAELYATTPTTDFDGLFVSRTWTPGTATDRELTADLYSGSANTHARFWTRDGLPPTVPAGASFLPLKISVSGLALSWRQPDLLLRASLSRTRTSPSGTTTPVRFPYVELAPGLGYYQVFGPTVPAVDAVHNTVFSAGAEIGLGHGWRLTTEVVRNKQHDTELGSDATASYIALFKQIGKFTPYLSVARLSADQRSYDWYERLTAHPLPEAMPGAAMLNAAQRLAAESYWVADQHSVALGSSYALSPTLRLKGEWMHTRIGRVSRLVDVPAGGSTAAGASVEVVSVNLNFAF